MKFRRDHPIGPYFADFCCIECHLIVEVDGSQHADQLDYDEQRTKYLGGGGFRVIRFRTAELIEDLDVVIERIAEELARPDDPQKRPLTNRAQKMRAEK